MRDYGIIKSSFWTNPKTQPLGDRAKLLASYLLTGPHANAIGCFRLPLAYVSADLVWSMDTVSDTVSALQKIGFLKYCRATNFVLIPAYLKHNQVDNSKVGIMCARMAEEVPPESTVFQGLIDALKSIKGRLPDGFIEKMETLSNTVCHTVSPPEPDPEPDPEPSSEAKASGADAPSPPPPELPSPPEEPAPPPPPLEPSPLFLLRAPADDDWSKMLFRQALAWLANATDTKPDKLRPLLGKWLQLAGGDHKRVFDLFAQAESSAVGDPKSWITAQLGGKHDQSTGHRNGWAKLATSGAV